MKIQTSVVKAGFAALILCAGLSNAVSAAELPEGNLTAIVPFSAGGTSDALARLYANALGKELNRTVVVDNRPGASGNIGYAAAARAKPDGLTIMFTSSGIVWNPALFNHLEYDPLKDLIPTAHLADAPQVINASVAKFPTQALPDILKYAKEHPGELNLAASGVGLVEANFEVQNGIDVEIIPYNGSSEAVTAVMSGEADIFMGSALNIVPLKDSGKIRPVVVAGPSRLDVLPDVPTTAEVGLPSIQISYFFGAYVPGGTPAPVVEELNAALNKVSKDPAVIKEVNRLGWVPTEETVENFGKMYQAEIQRWKDTARQANIKPLD